MSMVSDAYARYANEEKRAWCEKLQRAIESESWDEVRAILAEMQSFYFSE